MWTSGVREDEMFDRSICVQLRSWVQKVLHIPKKIKVVVFNLNCIKILFGMYPV